MNIAIKRLKGILVTAVFIFLVYSCEQIIQVSLNDEQPNIVIEGVITTDVVPFTVRLSESQAYYNQSGFKGIENARVQMDNSLTAQILVDKGSGFYSTSKRIRGNAGSTYHLNVTTLLGQQYSSTIILPPLVPIDTVYFVTSVIDPDSLNACIEFNDPVTEDNYYRLKLYRNGRFNANDYFLFTDITSNGQRLWVPIYFNEFAPGDSVVAELENLERNTYLYLKSLSEIVQEGINVQAPGNPPSNISGGALGYFGAWGTSRFKAYIPK